MENHKFKPGDTILFTDGNLKMYISELSENGYETNAGFIPYFNDDQLRLWNIDDAVDGDIIFDDEVDTVFIFKELKDDKIFTHCSISTYEFSHLTDNPYGFNVDEETPDRYYSLSYESRRLKPATKEQCDLLFEVMNSRGYVFDYNKNELRLLYKQSEIKPMVSKNDKLIHHEIYNNSKIYSLTSYTKLFYTLNKEQQDQWRHEIEQAYINGANFALKLSHDMSYKENQQYFLDELTKRIKENI